MPLKVLRGNVWNILDPKITSMCKARSQNKDKHVRGRTIEKPPQCRVVSPQRGEVSHNTYRGALAELLQYWILTNYQMCMPHMHAAFLSGRGATRDRSAATGAREYSRATMGLWGAQNATILFVRR